VPQRRPKRVLFLSAGDGSRGLMAQALLRQLGGQHYDVVSACSRPPEQAHPAVAATLTHNGLPADNLVPKEAAAFTGQLFDYVIALCDHRREACPAMTGAETIHWTFPDPSHIVEAGKQERIFHDVFQGLATRIRLLLIVDERP
jgi:ArsR family transcriptional regulator